MLELFAMGGGGGGTGACGMLDIRGGGGGTGEEFLSNLVKLDDLLSIFIDAGGESNKAG